MEDHDHPVAQSLALGTLSAVCFAAGLALTEAPGEVAVDIDLKPFVIPYLLIALSRYGIPTLAIGFGGAVGEGILDIFEGYELDDPVGFLGYVLGFTVFGRYLEWRSDPPTAGTLSVGAVLGAFVQAVFEGIAFFIFRPSSGAGDALLSIIGNTVSHGVILGAIPLVALFPVLRRRLATAA